MRRQTDGDPGTRFQALKRVGPPLRNQGSSVDSLQAIGYYKIMNKKQLINQNKKLSRTINFMSEGWSRDYRKLSNKIICLKKKLAK